MLQLITSLLWLKCCVLWLNDIKKCQLLQDILPLTSPGSLSAAFSAFNGCKLTSIICVCIAHLMENIPRVW